MFGRHGDAGDVTVQPVSQCYEAEAAEHQSFSVAGRRHRFDCRNRCIRSACLSVVHLRQVTCSYISCDGGLVEITCRP